MYVCPIDMDLDPIWVMKTKIDRKSILFVGINFAFPNWLQRLFAFPIEILHFFFRWENIVLRRARWCFVQLCEDINLLLQIRKLFYFYSLRENTEQNIKKTEH